jgi:mono/diheme cytochrome c family protein
MSTARRRIGDLIGFPPVELAAISTTNKIGLAAVGAVFITFSLVSALLIPRWRPDFPGRGRNLFVLVCVALLVGMMAAVFVFGGESEESQAGEAPTTETQTTGEQPPAPPPPTGDATAGKAVFDANGCGSCHTFAPAGSTGTVGPDLSQALQGKDAAFIRESIVDPNAQIASGYQPNIMPGTFGDQLSRQQLDDVVAFLQSS